MNCSSIRAGVARCLVGVGVLCIALLCATGMGEERLGGSFEPVPSLEQLEARLQALLPRRGATSVRYLASDERHRGGSWYVIDWESLTSCGTNGFGFGGRTLDGRRFGTVGSGGTEWVFYDETGSEPVFELSPRRELSGIVPSLGLLDSLQEDPDHVSIATLDDGRIVVEANRPIPQGTQRVRYILDSQWRVVEVRPGEPVPSFPTRFEYEDGPVETGSAVLPSVRVFKLGTGEDLRFVRADMQHEDQAPTEWFSPEHVKMEMVEIARHTTAIAVRDPQESAGDDGEADREEFMGVRVAPRSPGRVPGGKTKQASVLILLGVILVVTGIVVWVRRAAG